MMVDNKTDFDQFYSIDDECPYCKKSTSNEYMEINIDSWDIDSNDNTELENALNELDIILADKYDLDIEDYGDEDILGVIFEKYELCGYNNLLKFLKEYVNIFNTLIKKYPSLEILVSFVVSNEITDFTGEYAYEINIERNLNQEKCTCKF